MNNTSESTDLLNWPTSHLDVHLQRPDLLSGAGAGLLASLILRRHEASSMSNFLVVPASIAALAYFIFAYSIAQIAGLILVFLLTLACAIVLYRAVSPFHPLHKVPGPFLDKCTQLVQFYQLAKGRPRIYQQKLHQRYGPVVRIGPNEVSICDTAMLSTTFGAKPWLKGKAYSFSASGGAATSETALSSIRDRESYL